MNYITTIRNRSSFSIIGSVFILICRHRSTNHSSSDAIMLYPNFTRQSNMDTFTSSSLYNSDYVYFGGYYGFQGKILEHYICQLIRSAISWNKFTDGPNLESFNAGNNDRSNWQKHFNYWFLKYYVIQFTLFIGSDHIKIPKAKVDFDQWIWSLFPNWLSAFVCLWTNHKSITGECDADCSRCVIINGHKKCRHRVCIELKKLW